MQQGLLLGAGMQCTRTCTPGLGGWGGVQRRRCDAGRASAPARGASGRAFVACSGAHPHSVRCRGEGHQGRHDGLHTCACRITDADGGQRCAACRRRWMVPCGTVLRPRMVHPTRSALVPACLASMYVWRVCTCVLLCHYRLAASWSRLSMCTPVTPGGGPSTAATASRRLRQSGVPPGRVAAIAARPPSDFACAP